VLRDIDLKVGARRAHSVICGPSGSGKSTLLRCIQSSGGRQSGRIVVDGIELNETPSRSSRCAATSAWYSSSSNLFPHLTVLENCTLAPIWVRACPSATTRRSL